jgi:hypothetical protein
MANEQNLKPCEYQLSQEEAKKGGIASGKARREKKTLREMVELFGRLKVDGKAARAMEDLGIGKDMQTRFMQGVVSLFNKANKGDVGAFNAIRDIIGEKPVEKTQLQGTLDTNITIGYVESGHQPVTNEEEIPE